MLAVAEQSLHSVKAISFSTSKLDTNTHRLPQLSGSALTGDPCVASADSCSCMLFFSSDTGMT